ncbi:MAG: hypothetical protein H0W20_13840 [Chthoniobacterales bacterium]|nr:hypothetical protein [Chthoniobacterales bacterium]
MLVPRHFRVKCYRHPRLKFVVRAKINGRWQRRFFESEAAATAYADARERELFEGGIQAVAFPEPLRAMALQESQRLQPFGKSISDAVDFYLAHLDATSRSAAVPKVVAELLHNRRCANASDRYVYEMALKLRRFAEAFPQAVIAAITTRQIDEWLERLALAAGSRNTFRRDLHTLFAFAVTRQYAVSNPVSTAVRAKDTIHDTIGILTVEQLQNLLRHASPATLPYWTIGAFSGLRRAEIERLDWAQIDLDSHLIEVKACHSKTRSRRLVGVQPNLAAWLAPHRRGNGAVCPAALRQLLDDDRARAGLKDLWPRNALRHSFGSYYVAAFPDVAALALQMGNSPAIVFRHYRQVVRPDAAKAYWSILPPPAGG